MKANGTFTSALMMVLLLAMFGFTAFRYFAIALSTGILDLGYLIGIWIILILSAKLNLFAGYALACLCGIFLTFPLSLFVFISEKGQFGVTNGAAFSTMISSWIVALWILEYVAVAITAQFAIRALWPPANTDHQSNN